jgi:hypothetical protein
MTTPTAATTSAACAASAPPTASGTWILLRMKLVSVFSKIKYLPPLKANAACAASAQPTASGTRTLLRTKLVSVFSKIIYTNAACAASALLELLPRKFPNYVLVVFLFYFAWFYLYICWAFHNKLNS